MTASSLTPSAGACVTWPQHGFIQPGLSSQNGSGNRPCCPGIPTLLKLTFKMSRDVLRIPVSTNPLSSVLTMDWRNAHVQYLEPTAEDSDWLLILCVVAVVLIGLTE